MWRFILKRLLHMIPLLIGVSLLTFLLMSLAPGDYFTALRKIRKSRRKQSQNSKHNSISINPGMSNTSSGSKMFCSGDFGYSMAYKIPATSLIFRACGTPFCCHFSRSSSRGESPFRLVSGRRSKKIHGLIMVVP